MCSSLFVPESLNTFGLDITFTVFSPKCRLYSGCGLRFNNLIFILL